MSVLWWHCDMNRLERWRFWLVGMDPSRGFSLCGHRRKAPASEGGRYSVLDCFGSRGSRLGRGCFDAGRGEPLPYKVWPKVTSGGER
jgi:hypothetical protein